MWLIRFSHSLSLIWFDKRRRAVLEITKEHSGCVSSPPPPTRTRISGSVLKVPVEGLSTTVPTAWLTGASGDAGKDGGESE